MTLARPLIEAGRLLTLFDARLKAEYAHYLVYPPRSRNHAGLAAFRDWLLQEAPRVCRSRSAGGRRGSAARAACPQAVMAAASTRNHSFGSPVLIAFNKPYGVLCQFTDRSTPPRRTLAGFGLPAGVYPAGRLDFDSEGLLLLTDDGALAHRLTDPRHKQPKTYWLQVEGEPSTRQLRRIARRGRAQRRPDPARRRSHASRRRPCGRATRRCASARPCPMPGWS